MILRVVLWRILILWELILFGSILRRWLDVLRSRMRRLNVLKSRLNVLKSLLDVLKSRLNVLRSLLDVLRWLDVLRFVILRIETRWFNNGCASWSS
jgi:uncharacterized Rmd1/YagE family protein